MKLVQTRSGMWEEAERATASGRKIVLVPTMGALHRGHFELVRHARSLGDFVVVSIFVNPTQFGPNEDFDRYPRTLQADMEALESTGGVDVVFAPSVEEMYPNGQNLTWVDVEELGSRLCGAFREGHFRGVTTVVAKLFAICRPHIAVFGKKDAQQLQILRRMTSDMGFNIRIEGVATVREADGLALSSRNTYLSEEERRQAVVLNRAVRAAETAILRGEQAVADIVEIVKTEISSAPLARIQYVEVVDAGSLKPIERLSPGQEVLTAAAVYFGGTRLIDNCFVTVPARQAR